jgi:hypothetical protein
VNIDQNLTLNPTPHVTPAYRRSSDTNHPVDWDVDAGRTTRHITRQVHVSTAQLLHLRQPRHTAVVFELLRPVGLLLHRVRRCCFVEA